MTQRESAPRQLTFQELTELRRRTEVISKFLHDQLLSHLETLRPILSPERVFGKYAGGRTDSTQGERAFIQLQQTYKPFSGRPYDLPSEFDPHWLSLVGTRVSLYPWEYAHEIPAERETRTITMSSPVRWVVSYTAGYTLSQFRQGLSGKGERRPEQIRQFVVNALVAQHVVVQTPGLIPLLTDLRYRLQTEYSPDLPKLPLTTITSGLPSFRPANDLIAAATSLSGVPAFVEVIDTDALGDIEDPLKAKLAELLR